MNEQNNKYLLLRNPLSDLSRKERRNLLASSTLGLLMVKMGFLPTKIAALGMEFGKTDQQSLIYLVGLLIAYFIFAFLIYAVSDFLVWRKSIQDSFVELTIEHADQKQRLKDSVSPSLFQIIEILTEDGRKFSKYAVPVSWLKAAFEFALPVIYGLVVVSYLLLENIT